MAARAILLIALLLPVMAITDDGPKLPSKKSSIVLPLLEHFSPKDHSPKAIMIEARKILGEPSAGDGGGPDGHQWKTYYFFLENGEEVSVGVCDLPGFTQGIRVFVRGQPPRIIWSCTNKENPN